MLAYFDRPGTSNGPTEAINGRLEHLRGSALGFRNLTNYIARSLLETGGFRPQLHPGMRRAVNGLLVAAAAVAGSGAGALHVHGGIGFTWEHPSHLYFRRAKSTQLLFGPPAAHLERLVALAVLAEEA